jgi:hypothetical protein
MIDFFHSIFLTLKNQLVVHDYDGFIYMRHYNNGGLLFGGFEIEAKPIFHESCPADFENSTLKPDLDHFCMPFCFLKILKKKKID